VRDDIANAGAETVDESAVVDGNLVTSRNPDDIPDFVDAIVEKLQ
jgi:protease I